MTKTVFVSGADHNYFPMLLEWIYSIRAFPESEGMDICILDVGLEPEQLQKLKPLVTKIHKPDWPCKIYAYKIRGREYMKAHVCRPFINKYFPGYNTYFWMDADTWVQNWRSVALFLEGAQHEKITLAGEVDRAYLRLQGIKIKWLGRWPRKVGGFHFNRALKVFGFGKARDLLPYHILNAGAIALHKDAPHWVRWQELVKQAAMKRRDCYSAEQLSLGVLCYLEGYKYEILPAWCHWICRYKPLYNNETGKFVEPFLPHEEIGILHLLNTGKMRLDRSLSTNFQTLDGNTVQLSYRYPGFDGEKNNTTEF